MTVESRIKSPIKWVGGKGKNVPTILGILPKTAHTYIEPFCGGFSVGLAYIQTVNPVKIYASDLNGELINFWNRLKENVDDLFGYIEVLEANHVFDPQLTYQEMRSEFNLHMGHESTSQAARFYYLNKCGFNGLYRVNKKGDFNTPRGDKEGKFADYENLRAVSELIQNVTFIKSSYDDLQDVQLAHGTVLYCDPPYVPASETANFVNYTPGGFDHADFAYFISHRPDMVDFIAVSNSDTPVSRELYKGFNIAETSRAGTINSKGSARGRVKELVFYIDRFATRKDDHRTEDLVQKDQ